MQFISPRNQGQALGPKQASQSPGLTPVNQPNEQQMLAQALRGSRGMPQQPQQFSEEEKMIIMQIMQQQNLSEEQAIQQYMRMKSG
tara:strand:- start:23 stop:280 length:258 start_codon:yes stop_codon:yes gene_type:complete